ncbi:MAG: type II toxin-antitoxin system VapB family antitoxin [Acidobacteriaceae bacterium]|jgi:Arc/MetJ family transcription regulator
MAEPLTSIRLDKKLADEVKAALGVKTRTEAVHIALSELAALHRFKKLMAKTGGKFKFAGSDE